MRNLWSKAWLLCLQNGSLRLSSWAWIEEQAINLSVGAPTYDRSNWWRHRMTRPRYVCSTTWIALIDWSTRTALYRVVTWGTLLTIIILGRKTLAKSTYPGSSCRISHCTAVVLEAISWCTPRHLLTLYSSHRLTFRCRTNLWVVWWQKLPWTASVTRSLAVCWSSRGVMRTYLW